MVCALVALATGDPTGQLPFNYNMASRVMGWPQSIEFSHPNNLSEADLKEIYFGMSDIKFLQGL